MFIRKIEICRNIIGYYRFPVLSKSENFNHNITFGSIPYKYSSDDIFSTYSMCVACCTICSINLLKVPPQQYVNVPVPVSMVEPTSGQRMLLTNRVQASGVAWPQTGRQMALVPSWPQQAPAHSLIVDPAPFLNVEEIYPKHLNIPRNDLKKESPVHHLV